MPPDDPQQLALERFGGPPARRTDPDTAVAAGRAQSAKIGRNRVRDRVERHIRARYGRGELFTAHEVASAVELDDLYEVTVRRQVSNMRAEGLVVDSGRRTPGPRRHPVILWRLAGTPALDAAPVGHGDGMDHSTAVDDRQDSGSTSPLTQLEDLAPASGSTVRRALADARARLAGG